MNFNILCFFFILRARHCNAWSRFT